MATARAPAFAIVLTRKFIMCLIVADVIGPRQGRTAMKAFRLDELEAERAANDGAYLQFLRERNMSVGLYALDAGELDPQKPHKEDEVYFVVSGRASITVGTETRQVGRGSVIYVPAGVPHKFHHITEDLRVMVVFSPPES
ncbi:cupin domain-containing protein [Streptomyces coeruleoprunus]